MTLVLKGSGIDQPALAAGVAGTGPAFSARGSVASQAVSTSVLTKVLLPVEDYDTAACFDSTTNYRFQPSVAGYYNLTGVVRHGANAGTLTGAFCEVWKNGATELRGLELQFPAGTGTVQSMVSGSVFLNGSTDYVELFGYTAGTSPAFVNVTANKAGSCFLQGFLARAA